MSVLAGDDVIRGKMLICFTNGDMFCKLNLHCCSSQINCLIFSIDFYIMWLGESDRGVAKAGLMDRRKAAGLRQLTGERVFLDIGPLPDDSQGSRKQKFTILGVEAPVWQGVKMQESLDMPSFHNAARRDASAYKTGEMHRRIKCEVIFE